MCRSNWTFIYKSFGEVPSRHIVLVLPIRGLRLGYRRYALKCLPFTHRCSASCFSWFLSQSSASFLSPLPFFLKKSLDKTFYIEISCIFAENHTYLPRKWPIFISASPIKPMAGRISASIFPITATRPTRPCRRPTASIGKSRCKCRAARRSVISTKCAPTAAT